MILRLLSIFLLISLNLTAQNFYHSPDNSYELIEAVSEKKKDHKNFSIPFDSQDPEWILPALDRQTSSQMHTLIKRIVEGRSQEGKSLGNYSLPPVPTIWNLLRGNKHVQEAAARPASELPGANGETFIYQLLLSPLQKLNAIGLKKINRLSSETRLGIWLQSNNKNIKSNLISDLLKNKKRSEYFHRYKDSLPKKESFSILLNKKAPPFIVNLYIDSLIDIKTLPFQLNHSKNKKIPTKKYQEAIKKCRADSHWKTLGKLRLGLDVSDKEIKKIAHHKNWYIRSRFCDALQHRKDLRWRFTPFLLERQRDICLEVRVRANQALCSFHHLPYKFSLKRHHEADSDVIHNWEHWWIHRQALLPQLKAFDYSNPISLKLIKNFRLPYGVNQQTFNILKGKNRNLKATIFLIDINGDGDFHDWGIDRITFKKKRKSHSLPLSRIISLNNKYFLIDIDSQNKTLHMNPYEGKFYPAQSFANYSNQASLISATLSNFADLHFPLTRKNYELPVGFYQIGPAWVVRKKSELAQISGVGRHHPIEIKAAPEVQNITYGPELSYQLKAEYVPEFGKVLLKDLKVIGQAGEVYQKYGKALQQVKVLCPQKKSNLNLGYWTAKHQEVTTQMLGGLTPPFELKQIQLYQGQLAQLQQNQHKLNFELKTSKFTKENELNNFNGLLESVTQQINKKNQELTDKKSELVQQKNLLDFKQKELENKQKELAQKEAELSQYQLSKESKEAIEELKQQAKDIQKQINIVCAATPVNTNLYQNLLGDLNETNEQIKSLSQSSNPLYVQLITQINQLQAEVSALAAQVAFIANKITNLTHNIAILTNEIIQLESQKVNYEASIATLSSEIAAIDLSIQEITNQNHGLKQNLEAGAGAAGKDFETFKQALHSEHGLRGHAIKLSDNVWEPFEIDLKALRQDTSETSLKILIKGATLPFGNIKDTEITVDLF